MTPWILPELKGPRSTCLDKLDGLAWRAGLSFTAYGARIGVRVTDPAMIGEVAGRLPTGWAPAPDARVDHLVSLVVGDVQPGARMRRFHLLYAGAKSLIRTLELDEALRALENHLERAVAEMAHGRLFLHAGVVAWKDRAMLIPGASHTGKTSLVAALIEAGAVYYSDEYAVLDRKGRVHPFPRPLVLRHDSEAGTRIKPEQIGARAGDRPLAIRLVAVTQYKPGARWRPRTLSPGQALLELIANTVIVRRRPEKALGTLEEVATRARTQRSPRGEARETAQLLLESLDGGPEPRP